MEHDEHSDPLIDEIHEIRERIWREQGSDLDRYSEHLMEFQKQFAGRLISRTFTPEEEARFQQGLEKLRSMTPEEFERWVAEEEAAPDRDRPAPVRGRQDRPAA